MLSKDRHHLLYQRRHWNSGWALRLRNHPYMIKLIPRETLHRIIHENVSNIPQPSGKECKTAYELISCLDKEGKIKESDPLEKRIELLLSCFENPETRKALIKQREVISQFYKGGY